MINKIKEIYKLEKAKKHNCFCPICWGYWDEWLADGEQFDVFKTHQIVGGGLRKHVCPNCSSTDRLRMIYTFLKYHTTLLKQNISILHVAPERQLFDIFVKLSNIEYYPVDKYNTNANIKEADITELKFGNKKFDLIICNHVLEHIVDDKKAMQELYRVLKQGGKAILQIPYATDIDASLEDDTITEPKLREQIYWQNDHVRIYNKKDFVSRLESVGFKSLAFNPYEINFKINPQKLGLNEKEDILFFSK